MKKYFIEGSAALVLCGLMASCSHDEMDYSSIVEGKKAAYQEVFVEAYGKIDPNQTWGFGTAITAERLTRAVFDGHWDGVHICAVENWENVLSFELPDDAVDVTDPEIFNEYGNYVGPSDASAYYVPKGFSGALDLHNMNLGGSFYNLGTLTELNSVNYSGTVTFYNAGTMTYTVQSGNRHTVINTGTLTVKSFNNLGDLYNGGTLIFDNWGYPVDIPNAMHIYSNGEGSVMMPNGGDMKAVCDIHGTLYVGDRDNNVVKNVKIQNSTAKYVCGIDCTGKVENVDGPLYTSNVIANELSFDGNPIYLTKGGHINVATTISFSNSACNVYAVTGSTALIEAKNFDFGNKNDFTHNFSDNIYFKVNGGYIKCDNCYAMGHNHYFNTVAEYLEFDGHVADNKSDEYALAKDRINAGNATGSPACGNAWTIGTPDPTPNPDPGTTPGGNDDVIIPTDKSETTENKIEVVTTTIKYETRELHEVGRVFCEDLGQISTNDLDFNDVVFDAYIYKVTPSTRTIIEEDGQLVSDKTVDGEATYKTTIVLLAAGGTLQLSLADKEVHNQLGGNSISTIINTVTKDDESHNNPWVKNSPVILGTDFSYSSIVAIPIIVLYGNGETLELTAAQGWAPHKILVPIGTRWCKERVDIATAYTNFKDYVDSSQEFWNGAKDEDKLYDDVTYELPAEVTKVGTKQLGDPDVRTTYRSNGSTTTGGYQGETVLSRKK